MHNTTPSTPLQNGTTVNMVAALEASMCSDVAVTGSGSAAEEDDEDVKDDED